MIDVRHLKADDYEVKIDDGATTTHRVKVEEAYYHRLTAGKVSREELIEESFRFLLERESAGSILSKFELPIIGRYFPEYEDVIRRRLRENS